MNTIYVIACVHTGDLYVGSTKNYVQRSQTHQSDMGLGLKSPKWNELVSRYGVDSFVFNILEETEENSLLTEQKWINILFPSLNISNPVPNISTFNRISPSTVLRRENIVKLLEYYVIHCKRKTIVDICSEFKFSASTLTSIIQGRTNKWLSTTHPDLLESVIKKYKERS